MSEHRQNEHAEPAPPKPSGFRRGGEPAATPSALAPLRALQRQAGNRAVAGLLAQLRPAQMQRQSLGARQARDNPYRLHLDPQIEAQIRAINAMNAMIAPETVQSGLLDLTLPQLPPAPGPSGASPPPLAPPKPPPSATPLGSASGTGLMGPRAGTAGDVWKAILAEPSLGPAITALGDQAAARAKSQWDQLSTGAAVAVVTGSVAVGGGAIVGVLANPDARQWITSTLNNKIIPVPKVPGLGVQLNLSGDNLIVGLHLDVGKVLPAALGFAPAAGTTPLGTPFPEPVQGQVTVQPEPTREHQADPVVQPDLAASTGGSMWLHRQAGNAATALAVQRLGWQDFDFIGGGLERLAKANFSVPLCKTLIDHYCHGNGEELGLTASGMVQCNALIDFGNDKRSAQFLRMVNGMGTEIARNAGGDPERLKQPLESDISFSMLGGCNTSGTLGDFTVNVSGRLKVWSPNAYGADADWSFEGSMWWYDRWDFDQRGASARGEPGRTAKGSWRTDVGGLLVGTPYDIKSAAVPVRQVRAEAVGGNRYAKWEGNPDGKALPVVAGFL